MTEETQRTEKIQGKRLKFFGHLEGDPRTLAVLTLISVAILLLILQSVLVPFVIACILAALTWPLRNKIMKWTGGRANTTSGILILGLILLVAAPVAGILAVATFQAQDMLTDFDPDTIQNWLESQQTRLEKSELVHQFGLKPDTFGPKLQEFMSSVASWGVSHVFSIGSSLFHTLVLSGIALMSLFYLYLTGDKMVERIQHLVPLPSEQVGELLIVFRKTSRAIFKGNFVIGGVQGLLTGILFWGAGLPSPALFGVAAAFCSLIPAVGSGLIWAPAGILLLANGEIGRAILVLGVGAAVISMIDNVLRPVLVGRDAGMHDLMVFLTTIGGLSFFGPVGILFGPLVGAGVTALVRLQTDEIQK